MRRFAQEFLKREGIAITGGSLGGETGRRIQFWPATGRVRQKLVRAVEEPRACRIPIAAHRAANWSCSDMSAERLARTARLLLLAQLAHELGALQLMAADMEATVDDMIERHAGMLDARSIQNLQLLDILNQTLLALAAFAANAAALASPEWTVDGQAAVAGHQARGPRPAPRRGRRPRPAARGRELRTVPRGMKGRSPPPGGR